MIIFSWWFYLKNNFLKVAHDLKHEIYKMAYDLKCEVYNKTLLIAWHRFIWHFHSRFRPYNLNHPSLMIDHEAIWLMDEKERKDYTNEISRRRVIAQKRNK